MSTAVLSGVAFCGRATNQNVCMPEAETPSPKDIANKSQARDRDRDENPKPSRNFIMSLQSVTSSTNRLSEGHDGLKIWSCTNCRRRKVRCDRRQPCIPCTRNNTECIFPISGRHPRRAGRSATTSTPGSALQPIAKKHEDLLSRLRSLENMVSELGSQVENAVTFGNTTTTNDSNSSGGRSFDGSSSNEDALTLETTGSSVTGTDIVSESIGDMVTEKNGDLVVGDRFWTVFCGEVERVFEAVRGSEPYEWEANMKDQTSTSSSEGQSHINYFGFLLRQAAAVEKYDLLYPPPPQMLVLWQTYVDDIDPFIKLIHTPSMTKNILILRGHYHSLGPGMEALVSAIALAATSILSEEDISVNFGKPKDELVVRYRLATEQALGKADLLTTKDIAVLQALAIYINVLLHSGERDAAWALAGVLQNTAARLNLHNDGSLSPRMPPFEIEMRRRLWWQICLIDSRAAPANASNFAISDDFTTLMPSNIDDSEFNLRTTKISSAKGRRTDLTIYLVRCEIWRLSSRLQFLSRKARKEKKVQTWLEEAQKSFEGQRARVKEAYLDHLDHSSSLDRFLDTMVLLFFAKIETIIDGGIRERASRTTTPQLNSQIKARNFERAIKIINYTYDLQNEATWRVWRWHIRGQAHPYIAIKLVLKELCLSQTWTDLCEQGYSAVLKYSQSLPEGNPQYASIAALIKTAQQNRANQTMTPSVEIDVGQVGHEPHITGIDGDGGPMWATEGSTDIDILGTELDISMDWQSWGDTATSGMEWEFGDIFNL